MKNFVDLIVMVMTVCAIIVVGLVVVTLPFAFLGFILLAAANVFSAGVIITYFNSAIVGFVASMIIGMMSD